MGKKSVDPTGFEPVTALLRRSAICRKREKNSVTAIPIFLILCPYQLALYGVAPVKSSAIVAVMRRTTSGFIVMIPTLRF